MHLSNQPNVNAPFQTMANASPAATANDSTADTGSSSSSNSASSTATITANDFLQLLVTELQNQDPTANTDPNEYVDQLVQVNDLQQQIQMNQTLDGGPTLTGASSGVLQELTQMNQTLSGDVSSTDSSASASARAADSTNAVKHAAAGNLSAATDEKTEAAAERVATALSGNPSQADVTRQGLAGEIPPSQAGAFAAFAARLRSGALTK